MVQGVIWGRLHPDLKMVSILLLHCSLLTAVLSGQTFAYLPGLIRQPTQQPGSAIDRAGDEKEIRMLELGKPIKRELAGGQQHTYRMGLSAGQFLKVAVGQEGIDVAVYVQGPDGKQIMKVNSEDRPGGRESVSLAPEAAGDYRMIVQPAQKEASAGSYEIRVEELRAATGDDRDLYEARKLYEKCVELEDAGNYDEAVPLIERVLDVRKRILGPEHLDVAVALNRLAVLYWYKSDYAKAGALQRQALEIQENILEPYHPHIAASLNNLANLYFSNAEYDKAEPLYLRTLEIDEKTAGPNHPNVATSLHNLATLYHFTNNVRKAEPLYQRALSIREKTLGPDHPEVARTLNNLAGLYTDHGDYEKAEPLYQRSVSIRERTLGPDHPDYADALTHVANLKLNAGDYEKAESLYQRVLAIKEKALGAENLGITKALHNLADLYKSQGEYDKAESLYQRSASIREKTLGLEHPSFTVPLTSLAEIYRIKGDYLKAESMHHRALAIQEKTMGARHPIVIRSLNGLATLYAAKGDIPQAIIFQSRADALCERNLVSDLATGSERQRLAYLATLSRQADQTISLHLRSAPQNSVARDMAATLVLRRKGRGLDTTSESLNSLRSRFSPEDRVLLDKLAETRSQIARFVLGGSRQMTAEQYRDRINSLEAQAEKYEADISHRSAEFRAQSLPITLESVQAAIPPDAALIEFATYQPFNAKAADDDDAYGRPRYVVCVLRRHGEIQWKELGDVQAIDKTIDSLRRALRNSKRTDVKRLARAVHRIVFQPISPLVGNVTRLLISPEGSLNLIPFVALVDERGRYMVERYSISYLTSGRDLLRLQVSRESKSPPLVLADPDFGKPGRIEAGQQLAQKGEAQAETSRRQAEGESARSSFRDIFFPRLPYTAEEGEALRTLVPDATLLTRRQATKTMLSRTQSPRILHIATHGFFLEDKKLISTGGRGHQALSDDPERLLQQLGQRGIRVESPLLRSGLALAGANEHNEEDNGIVTAMEMSGLNLWGTKLVVLSACDTGVGEVRNGDGVHGLRRALVLAGSETQVMSLWAVSDKWTRELMVSYYRLLQQGHGRGEALRQVQLKMLRRQQQRHPYYWASFIQSGEWANLDGTR